MFDDSFRFDNFVVGASNRLAASAANAVADAPGFAYNPLFIYGKSGLGKTHLAAAIAYHVRLAQPELRVEITSSEEIVGQLHRAIANGQQDLFAERFRDVDLLVLDDVQFLAGQKETQSELLRLFNMLQGRSRQVVMTSDRPLADIPDVDQRLLSRLSGGLVVDVGAPDFEMRLAILLNVCVSKSLVFGDGVIEEVARIAFGNVRELKGALNRLTAFQQLEGNAIGVDDVRAVLGERPRAFDSAVGDDLVHANRSSGEYEGFLADILPEVESRVEHWRVALGEACAFWRSEGYVTSVLERAMAHPVQPDVDGLLRTFTAAVERLRSLEAQAVAISPTVRGNPAFRNPEQIAHAQAQLDHVMASMVPLPAPLAALTRSTLEAGSANQLALKAFDAIVELPGARFNPLLVHGPHGVGKTHIAHALGNAMRGAWPTKSVACVTASAFSDELVAAMQDGTLELWRKRYRAAHVLILDDVQTIADRERTQEELFHLFNHLHDSGGQIVLTSDRPPRELTGISDRLRSRFEGGLVVALQSPDRALRERLVTRWLHEAHADASPELIALLSSRDVESVRELSGTFKQIVVAAETHGFRITLKTAQRALGITPSDSARHASPRLVPHPSSAGEVDDFFLDREKVIWDWPDVGGRVIEEFR